METYGRNDLVNIATMLPGKTFDDVKNYHTAFWSRGPSEVQDFERWIAPIKKAELVASREANTSQALQWKLQCYSSPERDLVIKKLATARTKAAYTQQHDNFLLIELFKHGVDSPNVYGCIRQEIL